jgi:hypothetical protein
MSNNVYRCPRRKFLLYSWLILAFLFLIAAALNWFHYQSSSGYWLDVVMLVLTGIISAVLFYRYYWEMVTDAAVLHPQHVDFYFKFKRVPFRVNYEDIKELKLVKKKQVHIITENEKKPIKINLALFEYPNEFWVALNRESKK